MTGPDLGRNVRGPLLRQEKGGMAGRDYGRPGTVGHETNGASKPSQVGGEQGRRTSVRAADQANRE